MDYVISCNANIVAHLCKAGDIGTISLKWVVTVLVDFHPTHSVTILQFNIDIEIGFLVFFIFLLSFLLWLFFQKSTRRGQIHYVTGYYPRHSTLLD